jgi:hypothetical protein
MLAVATMRVANTVDNAIATIANGPGDGVADRAIFVTGSNTVGAYIYDGSERRVSGTTTLSAGQSFVITAKSSFVDNVVHQLACFLDGKREAVLNVSNNGFTSFNLPRIVAGYGGNANGVLGSNIDLSIFLVFSRGLSDLEIKTISDNPWQIFIPRQTIAYSLLSSNLFSAIDETVSDRNDYIKSSTPGQVYQTTLQSVSQPGAGTNIDFNFDANSPTDSGSIKFDLLSGSKLIKSQTVSLSRNWAARLPPRVPAVSPQPLGLGEWPRINIGDPIARDISSVTLGGRPNIYQLAVALPDGRVTTTSEGNAGAWPNNERVFDGKYGYGSKAIDGIGWGSSGSFGISLPSVNSPNTTGLTMMYIGSVRNLSGASGEYSLMTIYGLGAGGSTQFIIFNNSGGVKNKLKTSVWARTGTFYQSSTVDFPANRVVCIVATHHKSQGQKLYIDGKLAVSQAGSAGLDIQQYVDAVNYVLIRGNDGSHDATHMTATWNRCLSANEVQSLFENPHRLVRSLPARAVCFPSPAQTTFPITPSDYSAIGSWPWTPTLRVTSQ